MRATLLAVLLLLTPAAASAEEAISVATMRLTLNPEDKSQNEVGRLRWRGGLALTSDAEGFGGLSDLLLAPGGDALLAVSDAGRWLAAELRYDAAGDLAGVQAARQGPLHDTEGRRLSVSIKKRQDAEALARLPDGSLVVAFEREHRIRRFAAGLDKRPEVFDAPPGIDAFGRNAGIEAMVTLADGRLLAISEGEQPDGSGAAWLRSPDGAWHGLSLRPGGLFRPTGAALLPDGDVLLLERRFTLLGGLGARVSRIAAATILPAARLEAEEIATFAPPLTLDNFEGIATHQAADGNLRITLLSDDNFNAFQRTLLVQFELATGD